MWKPTASNAMLQQRALFLKAIRDFFDKHGVMEVDPPVLYSGVATDPGLNSFAVRTEPGGKIRYLQTSPEFPMKRLLAANSGPIYYLGKAFRQGECGKKHNPEFTMLEWYRPGWDYYRLINEVEVFLHELLGTSMAAEHHTYQGLFESRYQMNPHVVSLEELQDMAVSHGWTNVDSLPDLTREAWLDLLFTHGIEPHLGYPSPVIILDYPATQAGLAHTRFIAGEPGYAVAERFEIYYQGLELANGATELTTHEAAQARFQEDLNIRAHLGLPSLPMDNALLEALREGLPPCAGVAMGVDRLFMLKQGESDISKVLPFSWLGA